MTEDSMPNRRAIRWLLPALLMLAPLPALAKAPAKAACDRRCLLGVLTEYTEAIDDNTISRLPLAPTVRVTSNGVLSALGKGEVWGPARRLPFRQVFVDPVTGSAVFYGIVTTATRGAAPGAKPEHYWFYVARLKVAGRKITAPPEYPKNNASVVMEVFKVQDGMIRHIWAFFRGNGQPASGWPDAPR
jgi:hypothetical protein